MHIDTHENMHTYIQCSLDYPTPLGPRLVQIIKKSEQIDENSYKKTFETVDLLISYSLVISLLRRSLVKALTNSYYIFNR